jgi:hypothetical protein
MLEEAPSISYDSDQTLPKEKEGAGFWNRRRRVVNQ